jgi:alpha-N-arabinofuranosidase
VIRWPGGCFASAYRWNQGIGPQHRRTAHPVSIWDQQDVYSFGTDEFIAFCRRVGAEPLIVVNIGTPTWVGEGRSAEFEQELLDWLEYCNGPEDSAWGRVRAANGHPRPYNVRFWEIDNETWHMSAAEYADRVRRVAGLMREQDPTIEVAACGSGGFNLDWNREIIERAADTIDYLSIHHYHLPEDFAAGPGAFERFFRETAELIAASANPDLKLYVSEWNAQSTDWRTGLYCGGLLNGFERCGDIVGMAGPALFLRHVSATEWDNAFINFDHRTWFPAPNYVVMKLWREHYAPSRIAVSGDTEGLDLSATMTADGTDVVVKAVNPTEAAVPLAIRLGTPNSTVDEATLQIIAPGRTDARNTLEAPQSVRPEPGEVSVDGNRVDLTLPPLSAAVLSITRNRGSAATALQ